MKKAIFTLGLFSMMMVLTSFTTEGSARIDIVNTDKTTFYTLTMVNKGGQQLPKSKGLDYSTYTLENLIDFGHLETKGGQQLPKKQLD